VSTAIYKSGQGYYTRMGTVLAVALLGMLGMIWLWDYASLIPMGGVNRVYVAAGTCILVGAVVTAITYWLVYRKPRTSEFLIATEGEVKKVNWSTPREVWGSTGVVIFTMIFLTIVVFLVDKVFVVLFSAIRVLDVPS
jgi:preprotein translocase SecE subunit